LQCNSIGMTEIKTAPVAAKSMAHKVNGNGENASTNRKRGTSKKDVNSEENGEATNESAQGDQAQSSQPTRRQLQRKRKKERMVKDKAEALANGEATATTTTEGKAENLDATAGATTDADPAEDDKLSRSKSRKLRRKRLQQAIREDAPLLNGEPRSTIRKDEKAKSSDTVATAEEQETPTATTAEQETMPKMSRKQRRQAKEASQPRGAAAKTNGAVKKAPNSVAANHKPKKERRVEKQTKAEANGDTEEKKTAGVDPAATPPNQAKIEVTQSRGISEKGPIAVKDESAATILAQLLAQYSAPKVSVSQTKAKATGATEKKIAEVNPAATPPKDSEKAPTAQKQSKFEVTQSHGISEKVPVAVKVESVTTTAPKISVSQTKAEATRDTEKKAQSARAAPALPKEAAAAVASTDRNAMAYVEDDANTGSETEKCECNACAIM
jgi:hypothetical protein